MSDQHQKQLAIETHSDQAELFAARYDTIVSHDFQDCFVYSRFRLNQWLDKYLPSDGAGKKLLDVGCGTGYHLARYRTRGFEISGMDGSEEMLKQARIANPNIAFEQGDVEKLPYADNSFDYVLCVEVLRYLPDVSACINEIARVLKPGGIALVTSAPPLQANLYPLVNRISSALKVGSLTQLKQFFQSAGELETVFKNASLSEVEIHGVYGGSLIWVERVLPAAMPPLLKIWNSIDNITADAPVLRHFANMHLVRAKKPV